jgi:2-iminoacetate synthase ThiH
VVRATGAAYTVTAAQVMDLIAQAGFRPAQRTTKYELIRALD